jgi:competence protein ComEC
MAVPLLLSRYFFYGVDVYNILSLSGIVILCFNPAEFLDPGFVLTFVLTAAIVAGRTVWDRFLHRMVRAVRELVSANLSASLVAIPLSLYYFKRYSFSGVLAGVILIPLTGVILMFGFTVVLAAPLSSALCTAVLKAADPFLCLFFALVDGFATHLDLTVFRASPPVATVLAVPLLFFLLGRPVRFRFQKSLLGLMITVLLLWMVLPAAPHRPGNLTVFFLDVGHGDAAVVLFPSGRSLLIDGGGSHSGFQVGKRLVHPFLIQKRLRINWVAVSHYHPDHCRGIVEIVGILKPAEVWLSSASVRTPGYRRLIDALPAATRIRRCKAADVLWIDKCRVAFLHPPEFIRADRTHNNHSQVISISSPHHTFLFTGDAEGVVEAEISNRDPLYLKADVLKVPHHGSRTSSTARFLDEVRPRIALFSHSTHNRFHFPHPEVKQRYIDRGIGMLSTARHGGVAVVSTAGGLALTVSK